MSTFTGLIGLFILAEIFFITFKEMRPHGDYYFVYGIVYVFCNHPSCVSQCNNFLLLVTAYLPKNDSGFLCLLTLSV